MIEQQDERPAEERGRDEREDEQYTTETPQDQSQQSALLDLEEDDDEAQPLGADERLDRVSAEANAEAVLNDMSDFTDDEEILDDFAERQMMPTDEQGLMRRMRQHHAETPQLSGGDVDAAWDQGADAGDETVAAEPTPDQDRVGEMGEALGVTYEDDEPLDFAEKVLQRDEERWELNPASAEDGAAESAGEEDADDAGAVTEEPEEDEDDFLDEAL